MNIGSGDGALVLGTSLLYPDYITKSRGVELIPGLVDRSRQHLESLKQILMQESPRDSSTVPIWNRIEFFSGNVHEPSAPLHHGLSDTTLAICFATTWSSMNNQACGISKTSLNGRRLPKLSAALTALPRGARVVIVDGKLNEDDGFQWEGDLRVNCPDTAPYSVASLYTRC